MDAHPTDAEIRAYSERSREPGMHEIDAHMWECDECHVRAHWLARADVALAYSASTTK